MTSQPVDFSGVDERLPSSVFREAQAERELVRCLTADELFAEESDANLVVPHLGICPGPPLGIIGQSYSGKTIAELSFGLAVALGKDLWGTWSVKQGPWLHLDYEQGRRHTKKRLRRLARGFGITDEKLRELINSRTVRISVFPDLNLTTDKAIDHFKRELEGVRLVTCDSLRCMIGAVNENASEVRNLLRVLTHASDATGAVASVIHHGGITPDDASNRTRREMGRGSSAIGDEWQSMLVMSKKKGDSIALVSHEKDRELGHEVSDFGLRIDDVPAGLDGQDPKWGLRVVHVDQEQMKPKIDTGDAGYLKNLELVRKCIADNPGIAGNGVVRERIGIRMQAVVACVRSLKNDGAVVELDAPQNGKRLYLTHAAPAGKLSLVPSADDGDE